MKLSTQERLQQIMKERHLKQVDILNMSKPFQKALNIKLGKSALSQYVNGIQSPDQDRIFLLSKTLNVSEPWLMGYDVARERNTPDPDANHRGQLMDIYDQLHTDRQDKVYDFANNQLQEQKKIINFPKSQPDTVEEEVKIIGTVSAGTGEYMYGDDVEGEDVPYNGPIPPHDYALRVDGDSMEPMFEDGQIIFVDKCDDHDVHSGQIVIADLNGDAFVKKIDIESDSVRLVSLNPKYNPITVDSFDEFRIMGIVVL